MLETGLSPLYIKTLKLQIDYVLKALSMPNSRLPKKAALKVINTRTSWYAEWLNLAGSCGMEITLDDEDFASWKPVLYNLITRVDEGFVARYAEEASRSAHRSIYSLLNHHLQERNYFHDKYKVEEISMMLRLRAELMKLNYIPHRVDLPIFCSICNLAEREDVLHFVGKCPILRETRRNILGNDFLSDEEVIDLLNELNVAKLFQYCKTALSYRERIITENF